MDACTIIAKNYVAYARVLARSFARHHPEGTFSVLVIDDFEGFLDPAAEPFELLSPQDIDCPEFEPMAWRYDVLELSTAVKPWLLAYLLGRGAAAITYLDPDIRIYRPLEGLDRLGQEHRLVLTPHNTTPIPLDGERPSQIDIMVAGVFNLGYVTLGQGEQTRRLLDWWSQRLVRDCRADPQRGYFVDQRWMDLMPGLVEDLAVVRDPEYNVAYWNLHDRALEHDGEGYTINGRPLAFFHFSGFDPATPQTLSRHQSRIRVQERPALARILREYAEEVQAAGHASARRWPYGFGTLPDGSSFGLLLRRLFGAGEEAGVLDRSPFTEVGYADFLAWLGGQDEASPPGITRAVAALYEQRADLRAAFPDLSGEGRHGLMAWVRENGAAEAGLPKPVVEAGIAAAGGDGTTAGQLSLEALLRRGPVARHPSSQARTLVRSAVLRAIKPYSSYEADVDGALLGLVRHLERQHDELRKPLVGEISARLDEFAAALGQLQAERRAIPYMAGEPFSEHLDPVAGRVLGYEDHEGTGTYRAFEDVFRGSETMIRERQRIYLPIIGDRQPVLDFGCGRGELLDLLHEQGTPYIGVDSDESMVARCHEKGLEAVCQNGLEYLEGVPDGSLGAIFAAQVIEHMPEAALRRLLYLACTKLGPSGRLILETVNPHSPPALKAFWVDLTHEQPIFPEVALELCREAGFPSAYVFHPNGTGDVERDRFIQGEYAVVATAGGAQRT